MAKKLNGRLNLTKIPKNLIRSAEDKNGNAYKYVYIDVVPKKGGADQFGYTHSVQIYDKESKQKYYLGDLKEQDFGAASEAGTGDNGDSDLPF